jgi:hypothetical protein
MYKYVELSLAQFLDTIIEETSHGAGAAAADHGAGAAAADNGAGAADHGAASPDSGAASPGSTDSGDAAMGEDPDMSPENQARVAAEIINTVTSTYHCDCLPCS